MRVQGQRQPGTAQWQQLQDSCPHLRWAWKSMTSSACLSMCTWKGCGQGGACTGRGGSDPGAQAAGNGQESARASEAASAAAAP